MPGAFEIVMDERKALVDKIISMMKQGYFSYAMANAHPDLKAISNFETLSNDEDGVLYIIRQLIHSRQ